MQDINASSLGVDGFLRFAVLRVMAWVQAAFAYLHYGYIDYIALQAVPWTATDEYLTGWAALVSVYQEDATQAAGSVTMTGTVGVPIPAGTSFNRLDNTAYISTVSVVIGAGGTVNVPVQAVIAALAGNSIAGTTISLSSPIPGVVSAGVVASPGIDGGTDQEAVASFRNRMLAEYAAPPQGGDRSDYLEWASGVPGVTREWVAPQGAGPGTVVIYTMFDVTEAAFGGFPQGSNGCATNDPRAVAATGDLLAVANNIFVTQPVIALVYSCAPIASPVPFTIANLGANNTPAMQAQIKAALTGMFLTYGQVGGTVNPDGGGAWPPIDPNAWYAALNAIPGLSQYSVTSPPSAPLTPGTGQLFTLGACSFTA